MIDEDSLVTNPAIFLHHLRRRFFVQYRCRGGRPISTVQTLDVPRIKTICQLNGYFGYPSASMASLKVCIRAGGTAAVVATLGATVVLAVRGLSATRDAAGENAALKGLAYRMIGPHRGGRSTAVTGIAGDHRTFYMGATGGGVWKTLDAGDVWENVSDPFFKAGSVGAIAVAPSDPRIVYVGTGSACIRNNVQVGIGVYKSTDAGATWQSIGLDDAGQIAQIRVDPSNAALVYVAVLGHAFGPNATRGVFRSKDGGQHWDKVLFVNDRTGAADLAMDARNPRVLYAALWTGMRQPWGLVGGSTDGGVFKTIDGGDHWTRLTTGLPEGPLGRIGIAVSGADSSRVFALVDAAAGGIFRSDDGGTKFERVNDGRGLTGRSWYYAHIFADPADPNVVYAGNQDFFRSTDAGRSFSPIPMPHGDNHALWIDPRDTRVMIEGNDGGATITVDGGRSWSTELNQPTAEIYRVVTDNQLPYRVYGTQQDQYDGLSLPSRSANFGERLQLQHWYTTGGMEGGFVALDPRNPDVIYADGPGGMMTRLDRKTMHLRSINVAPADQQYRFAWTSPIFISLLEPEHVYHTSQMVHRTGDGGQTWTTISPDLTRNDKSRQPTGSISSEPESYPTVSSFAESKRQRGILWAGSDDGLVHVSRDGGSTWANVTPKEMPDFATVYTVEPSAHDPRRAFVAASRHLLDDFRPYVFRTDDYGQTWTRLTDGANGIPTNEFVRVVREDPARKGLLYAGTEFGVYVSMDDGRRWQSLKLNLPAVPVTDIDVHDADLVLSTNGRSFWILDDITPLREMAAGKGVAATHLFQPRDTYRIATSAEENDQPYVGGPCCVSNPRDLYAGARIERHQLGEEPPDGAIVYLQTAQPEAIKVDVLSSDGRVVRTIDTSRMAPGLNRLVWDLRVRSAGASAPPLPAPKAVPGTYRVRVSGGGAQQTASFKVLGDPRGGVTTADYQQQFDLLSAIADAIQRAEQAAAAIRGAGRTPSPELAALLREIGTPGGGRGGRGSSPPIVSQLTTLYEFVAGSEDKPTASAVTRWNELKQTLDDRLTKVRALAPK
jgi:photosystem II stability/assembly factor-like uncharacterized protein